VEPHLTREKIVAFLLEAPMFEALEPLEIMRIVHIVEVQQLHKGEVVFEEGAPGDAWFVLYEGSVDVLKGASADEKAVIATRRAPECFGEIAILDGASRSATVRAAEKSVVLKIQRGNFAALLENGELVAYKLVHQMAVSLARRQRAVTDMLSSLLGTSELDEIVIGISEIVQEVSEEA
jgi:CRP-like cAMP-binding protein